MYFFVRFLLLVGNLVLADFDLPLARLNLRVATTTPSLAPTKALKSGATAMPRAAAQPPTGRPRTAEEITT
jgi:hypothetical protein